MNQLRFQNYGSIPFGKEADWSNGGGYLWPLTEVDNTGLSESSGCARRMTGATVPAFDEINITYLTATCVPSPVGIWIRLLSLSQKYQNSVFFLKISVCGFHSEPFVFTPLFPSVYTWAAIRFFLCETWLQFNSLLFGLQKCQRRQQKITWWSPRPHKHHVYMWGKKKVAIRFLRGIPTKKYSYVACIY